MSTGPLPHLLDLRKMCDKGGETSGIIELDRLPRLREFAGEDSQLVEAFLRGFRDDNGRYRLEGKVDACLYLTCQRCLQPVSTAVHARVDLVLVWNQESARELPEALEPWVVGEEQTELASLLEEEILLALPLVALHDNCQPPANPARGEDADAGNKRENPFSVLAELKKRQD